MNKVLITKLDSVSSSGVMKAMLKLKNIGKTRIKCSSCSYLQNKEEASGRTKQCSE
jgi:hypothetical protein